MSRGIGCLSLAWVAVCAPWVAHGQKRPAAPPAPRTPPALSLLESGAPVDQVVAGLQYADALSGDGKGNVYFADVVAGRIMRWSASGRLSIVRDGAATPMGTSVAPNGEVVACEARGRRVTATDADGYARTLVETYQGKKLNSPCGVWADAVGGVYFSDPRMDHGERFEQDRERLYYLAPGAAEPTPVAEDLQRPEALIASPDGRTLYVSDIADSKTWAYSIGPGGALTGKRLLAPAGARGLALDERGNVYLISGTVRVFSPSGGFIEEFRGPGPASSGAFGGEDGRTFLLACNIKKPIPGAPPGKVESQGGLYAVRMKVRGPAPMAPPVAP
ncbi:MAG: SMP-30/gluconolactonase/LRE family protein [Verrucomicrobiae bacterium]|nr:SMP-30/gluconolactonase/LRE family protein [Verrucomicrobiae bacterium]